MQCAACSGIAINADPPACLQDYFGADANGTLTTIVDTDIYGSASSGYCKAVRKNPSHAAVCASSKAKRCEPGGATVAE
jgi:hypothetical protein